MKIRSLVPVTAAVLAAGVLGLPSAALAADRDTAKLAALNEVGSDGKSVLFPIRPGESVPVVAGVANQGDQAVNGLVIQLRIVDDLTLPKEFSNCLYYVDSNLHGAWCQIDADLAPDGKYALAPLHVSAPKDAKKAASTLIVDFVSQKWADDQGGIAALAKSDSGQGTIPAAGTGGQIGLVAAPDLPLPKEPKPIGFYGVDLRLPSASPSPSTSPSASSTKDAGAPTATPSSSATGGGGLPLTGSNSAVAAGLGAVLLAGGAAAFVLTRRRRAKFVA